VTDADAEQNVQKIYTTTYDEAGRVASAGDGVNDLEYTYSIFGLLSSTTQDLDGLSDDAVFKYSHDVLGRKTMVSAQIGTTDDYVNRYAYVNPRQLTGADYDFQTDESYSYDDNGNRTNTGYATGDHNRLTNEPARRRETNSMSGLLRVSASRVRQAKPG
jgi:hypothetical protein